MNPEPITPAFLRPGQAAQRCSVSRRTVNNWIRTGILPVCRMGARCTLIAVADLDTMLLKLRTGGIST